MLRFIEQNRKNCVKMKYKDVSKALTPYPQQWNLII